MPDPASQLSPPRRHKWFHISVGVGLLLVSVALVVGWHILGVEAPSPSGSAPYRYVVYFLGMVLFLLLIGGLTLIVLLLVREVRLNERQSNFVSAVTHELKTPVASLKLYLDTLEMRQELPDERRREFYRTMRQDIDRLHGTIDNVLNAARYTDRKVEDPQPLDFAKLARHAVEITLARNQLPPEAIRYRGPHSLTLGGDAGALETAVLNLLDNAVKYSGDQVEIDVGLSSFDGSAHLAVRDRGIGMTRAHLRFIFNRFYRIGTEVRRSRRGTGLGLFIVRSIVKGHRGTVTAHSAGPQQGTTITITLPGVIDEAYETAVAHA